MTSNLLPGISDIQNRKLITIPFSPIVFNFGEANIEELNIIGKGSDYGWPNRKGNYGIATLPRFKSIIHY